jgi:hypothetical protein
MRKKIEGIMIIANKVMVIIADERPVVFTILVNFVCMGYNATAIIIPHTTGSRNGLKIL